MNSGFFQILIKFPFKLIKLRGGKVMKEAEKLEQFKQILDDNAIINLGKEFGIEDQRRRKITLPVFFWLMVFACTISKPTGCLSGLCTLFAIAFCHLFEDKRQETISKAAISKKTSKINWLFFKDVFHRLLKQYQDIFPNPVTKKLKKISDIKILDSTVIQVCKKLETMFKSTKEGIATIKVHLRFSFSGKVPEKITVTEGKCSDHRFKFQEPSKNILYIFDLGYYKPIFLTV